MWRIPDILALSEFHRVCLNRFLLGAQFFWGDLYRWLSGYKSRIFWQAKICNILRCFPIHHFNFLLDLCITWRQCWLYAHIYMGEAIKRLDRNRGCQKTYFSWSYLILFFPVSKLTKATNLHIIYIPEPMLGSRI